MRVDGKEGLQLRNVEQLLQLMTEAAWSLMQPLSDGGDHPL